MTADQATVGAFAVTALVAVAAGLRWVWPKLARLAASVDTMFETINGKPAEIDRAGRQVSPPVPSLSVQLADLRDQVLRQADQDRRITDQGHRITHLEGRVDRLESGAQVERIVSKVESAQAWKAVEAVASQPPPEEPQP